MSRKELIDKRDECIYVVHKKTECVYWSRGRGNRMKVSCKVESDQAPLLSVSIEVIDVSVLVDTGASALFCSLSFGKKNKEKRKNYREIILFYTGG